ncbi:MAG TPA: twin transmembrane helix small protein [Caulobacteraceae bacterium]
MHAVFTWLIPIALALVALTLAMGIYSLFRGGEFALKWSNKLMRLRVLLQFCAILVLVAAMLWGRAHPS